MSARLSIKESLLRTFGGRVKTLRQLSGLTQPQLVDECWRRGREKARIAGATEAEIADLKAPLSQGYLSRLENDAHEELPLPGGEIILILAEALNTTTEFLFGRIADPNPLAVADPDYLNEEAREAARIVAPMSRPFRLEAVKLLRGLAAADTAAAESVERRLKRTLDSIERLAGPEAREEVARSVRSE